ncbi:isochorismatase family protein [Kitasatospora aureofaciens]|uniref:isochorismatase family protein n=1 Tax=Kitasatospora aureofaciens TaxID=1894 RepID=UPI001C4626D0|nr:isochorismatase family protein [Kitasatospora aureofaciens]MBV6700487.1 isochorismatase family protein [Kitasatospora aureofaciens]
MRTLDPRTTALVLIDLMDRIVANPLAPRPGSEVVAASLELAQAFRAAGAPVVAVRVERPNVAEQPPGSDLVGEVATVADEIVVKRTIGAFHGTGLHELLQARGVDTVVLTGIATNLGVESTARAASDHGYELVFVEDAMAALTEDEHRAAVTLNFPRLGEVVERTALRFG